MTPTQTAKLKKLAESATPGPWFVEGEEVRYDCSPFTTEEGIADCTVQICYVGRISEELDHRKPDRDYICAANPSSVLELIEKLEVATNALDYYANRGNWLAIDNDCENLTKVPGSRARTALAQIRGSK